MMGHFLSEANFSTNYGIIRIIIIIIIIKKMQLGCHPVAVVILHVHKYKKVILVL